MCLGMPMKITEIDYPAGTGEIDGIRRDVNLSLLDPSEIKTGNIVLVHAGFAVSIVDEQYVEDFRKTVAEVESLSDNTMKSW